MSAVPAERAEGRAFVPRQNRSSLGEALFSLSQAQRRLAHRYKADALQAEAENNYHRYAFCRLESDRLWRSAKAHLAWARRELNHA